MRQFMRHVKNVETFDYNLILTFNNNEVRRLNMLPYMKGWYSELKDKNKFNSVQETFGGIEWESGQDLAPEFLYSASVIF